jgi:TRAP-type C4-dicarboxylate transport system substrate-binding protein
VATAVATALALLLAGCSGAEVDGTAAVDRAGGTADREPVVLTLAQPNGEPPDQLVAWADEVDRRTGGTLQIEFANAWRIGEADYEQGTLEDVKAGEVDLGWVGARALDRVGVTSFQALLAPLLVDSYDLQDMVFQEGIPQQMLEGLKTADLVGVGVLPGPMRKILGVSGPLQSPADFEGKVIGLQDSALSDATLQALGATPKPAPSSAALDGMDGYEQQLSSIAGNGYGAEADSVTSNVNLWPRPLVIVAGTKVFASLRGEQQAALREGVDVAIPDALEGSRAEDDAAVSALCQQDVTLATASDDDLGRVRTALDPVYADLEADPQTAEYLSAISDLKDQVAARPEAPTCESTTASAAQFPEGTFDMVLTQEEAIAGCVEDDADKGDVYYTMVVGDGAITMTLRQGSPSAPELPAWSGTYDVYRDKIEFSAMPTSARWEFDGERLTFSEIDGGGCGDVTIWGTHPWVLRDG